MTTKNKIKYIVWLFVVMFAFAGCKNDQTINEGDSGKIVRYEKLLFGLDTSSLKDQFMNLKSQYPDFSDVYFKNVLGFNSYQTNDDQFYNDLKLFITDTNNIKILNLVNEEFKDINKIEKDFDEIVSNLQKEFPAILKPKFYTFISMFAYQGFIFDDNGADGLAIGLDMFLGGKFPYSILGTKENVFSNYMTRTYNKDHLYKKVVQLWLEDRVFNNPGNRAVDQIIENGKKLYLMKKIIPEIQDTVLFEYSKEQLKWVENNEHEMWSFFIKNNFFYTTDEYKIKRLVSPGPNSQALGMPLLSPGQTGNYVGYRIIQSYMTRNNETGISVLINNKDAQNILETSKFKPKIK
ncbi:MAG: hypothetical protein IPH57_12215 [Saprospiraceae bacterium]|nr:hypothetical protein [Saprospiraceae bacterium]